ncbi:peptidase S8/S53 domain-containing protein [Fennellomyces sp. T-0311]|nr:peptidase S8/S53 domain-containing protein [Fennellomyces sp. T-0311]
MRALRILLLCTLCYLSNVHGQEPIADGTASLPAKQLPPGLPHRFMIEFAGDDADQSSGELLRYLKNTFDDIDVAAPRVFNHRLWRGAMLEVDQQDIDYDSMYSKVAYHIKRSGLVSNVFPSQAIPRASGVLQKRAPPGDEEIENFHLLSSHTQTQVDRVRNELGYTGEGILVGIIDTGVDYNHPALGGGFGEGYKVRYGKDMIGDMYLLENPEIGRQPDDDPMESCKVGSAGQGHGTHVAGIIAGKSENFTGVAPDATLAVWRAISCDNLAIPDAVIEAMLEAADLGVDILSLSLGQFSSWPEEAMSVLADRISADGVKVVAAAGNSGADGPFTVASPAVSDSVISAASINSDYQLLQTFEMTGSSEVYGYSFNGGPGNGTSNIMPNGQVVIGDVTMTAPECLNVTIANDVQGKLSLVRGSSGCSIPQVLGHHAAAGSIGVIFYGAHPMFEAQETAIMTPPIPVSIIAHRTALVIIKELQSNEHVELAFSQNDIVAPVHSRDIISEYSSIGPSSDLRLRPSIAGIGGYVYSTLPLDSGAWATMSGTSMACPYMAGVTALYLSYLGDRKGDYSAADILERYQNYAYKSQVNPDDTRVDTPLRQGAGLVQLYDSITQPVHVSPGSISFNDTANLIKTHTLTVTNHGDSIASYEITNNVSVSVVPFNDSAQVDYTWNTPLAVGSDSARLRFSRKTIKISPGSSAEITVSVMPPDTDLKHHIMYGGYVQFKSHVRDYKDITVPYFGIVGNQRDLPIFDQGGPLVSDINMTTWHGSNDTFVFERTESTPFAMLMLSLITGPRHIFASLYDETGSVLGSAFPAGELDFLARMMKTYSSSVLHVWNGTYYRDDQVVDLKPGNYRIGFEALKVFGDPNNSHDWEKHFSATIQIV